MITPSRPAPTDPGTDAAHPRQPTASAHRVGAGTEPTRVAWLPMGLVLFALVLLIVMPVVIRQRQRPLWREITQVLEPSRDLANDMQAALALEMSAVRGYVLTGDERFLELYRRERVQEERLKSRGRNAAPDSASRLAGALRACSAAT